MAVTEIIAVTHFIHGVITAVTSTGDAVMTGLPFARHIYRVREDFGIVEDLQEKFIELGDLVELGRVSKRNLASTSSSSSSSNSTSIQLIRLLPPLL
jgi:hypothetical protein